MLKNERLAKQVYMRMLNIDENKVDKVKPIFEERGKVLKGNLSSEFKKIDFKGCGYSDEDIDELVESFGSEIPKGAFEEYKILTLRNIALSRKHFDPKLFCAVKESAGLYYRTVWVAMDYVKKHGIKALTYESLNQIRTGVMSFEEYKEIVDGLGDGVSNLIKGRLKDGFGKLKTEIIASFPGIGSQVFDTVIKAADIYIDDVMEGVKNFTLERIYGKSKAE